jgi:hypothetical protein
MHGSGFASKMRILRNYIKIHNFFRTLRNREKGKWLLSAQSSSLQYRTIFRKINST